MLFQGFGEHSLGGTQVYELPSRSSKTQENVKTVRKLIDKDRRQATRQLSQMAGVSYRVRQDILTENLIMNCEVCRPSLGT